MNSRPLLRFGVLIGVVLGLWMCSKEPDVAPQKAQEPLYSVAKARAYYDGASCTTRTMAEPGPLTPGNYSLDWDQAEVSLDSLLSSVDVPIEMQYRYYRYLQSETDSVDLVPIYSKLVVVKEHPTLLEGCYIRYMMPARSMIRAYPDFDYDALLNSRPKTDFSGVSVYTDLNGWPMCVAYYYEGELLVDAFLFDKAHTLEENIARLSDLLGDLTVARCSQVGTRATETNQDDDAPKDGGEIEEVVIVAKRPSTNEPPPPNFPNPVLPEFSDGNGGGGGGSSSGNSGDGDGDDNSSKHNDKIKFEDEETKEIIEPLLDSISQDCMGQTLLAALDGVTIKIHGYDPINNYNSFNPENNIIHLERHKTYGIRDYVLLEELIHCYQVQQQGYLSIGKQLNNEIEAKVGWLLARKRNKKPSNTNAIVNAFYNQETLNAMYSLSDHFVAGSNPSSQDYKKVYIAAINGLRMLPGYSNITISHLDEDWQFDVLTILMANCPEFNN